jgi:hypothetical protein
MLLMRRKPFSADPNQAADARAIGAALGEALSHCS